MAYKSKEKQKEYYQRNKEAILLREKLYRAKNREKINAYIRKYRKLNPELQRKYRMKKRDNIKFRLINCLCSTLSHAIRGKLKGGSAVRNLGCTIPELKTRLELQFQPGMSWENYGRKGWHIDHIIPLDAFDLTNPEEVKIACHYTNLQPLWAIDNLRKSNKIK